MTSPAPAEDRLEIQGLVAEYAFRCDTKLYSRVADLFTEDGVFDETVAGMPMCENRTSIDALFCSMEHADLQFLFHMNGNHRITGHSETTATATCHLLMEGHYLGNAIRILGYYADEYRKTTGQWLFRSRRLVEITPSTGFASPATTQGTPRPEQRRILY